jgi:hypothetical protein
LALSTIHYSVFILFFLLYFNYTVINLYILYQYSSHILWQITKIVETIYQSPIYHMLNMHSTSCILYVIIISFILQELGVSCGSFTALLTTSSTSHRYQQNLEQQSKDNNIVAPPNMNLLVFPKLFTNLLTTLVAATPYILYRGVRDNMPIIADSCMLATTGCYPVPYLLVLTLYYYTASYIYTCVLCPDTKLQILYFLLMGSIIIAACACTTLFVSQSLFKLLIDIIS